MDIVGALGIGGGDFAVATDIAAGLMSSAGIEHLCRIIVKKSSEESAIWLNAKI
jgi:hypothetical protein